MKFVFDFPFYLLVGIYVVQVMVTSFYSPWLMRRYSRQLIEKYPPAEYPRLYPESPEVLKRKQTILRRLNAFIGIAGLLAILASLLFWEKDMPNLGLRDFLHPLFVIMSYCGIQVVPTLIYARWGWLAAKRMREMGAPTRRSATLQRLKITDYISPALVIFGLASTMTAFILSTYWLVNRMVPQDFMISIVANGFFLSLLLHRTLWAPQFKRTDPFMSQDDLFRQRGLRMRVLFRGCSFFALVSLFIAAARVGILGFDPNISYIYMVFCLLYIAQSLYLSRFLTRTLEQTDFSVYRRSHNLTNEGGGIMAKSICVLFLLLLPGALRGAELGATRKPGDVVLEAVSLETALGKVDFELGTIFVPENRSDPQSRIIGVGFARFRAPQSTGAPPTFHLPGGPGESFLRALKPGGPQLAGVLTYVRLFRGVGDLIFVDQRGASERGEILSAKVSTPARSPDEPLTFSRFADFYREAARTAVAESIAAKVDLRGYTVLECADDVDDLRRALGYDKISLVGLSFGAQWSLAVMRLHPDVVARALLTGVEPLDSKVDMPSQVYAALQRIWFEAGQQPDLRPYIPPGGLTSVASEILERLEREPVRVTVKPNDGKEVTLTLGPFDFQRDFLRLAQEPKQLLEILHGEYESWASEAVARTVSREVDFELLNPLVNASLGASPDRIALLRGDPAARFLGRLSFDLNLETADSWPSPDVGDEFRRPMETQTPVVFVQGDWDISTPIEDTLALAPYFPNSRVLIVHRGLHNGFMPIAVRQPLVMRQLLAFLETGKTDGLPVEVTMPARKFALPDFPPPTAPK